ITLDTFHLAGPATRTAGARQTGHHSHIRAAPHCKTGIAPNWTQSTERAGRNQGANWKNRTTRGFP
ncbi:hypothetical protein, partial [Leisingera sp.]|uniref:hypothetical protein n=1 Tax=Leisingera sp. TaxID=1879318 RepID=UPI003A9177C4